jgi:diadenosine tetraphosphate (Ap4A) HIT family hydrolase
MTTRFGKASWKDFTEEDLEVIRKEREVHHDVIENIKKQYPNATYGLVCRACQKPNSIKVDFCTGCGFPCTPDDIEKLPDNVFLDIIRGTNTGTVILYRDDDHVVFNDKFGVSENHLDIIPVEVIEDISSLGVEHVPLLEKLYELGLKEFESRNIELYKGKDLRPYITAGYNFPVSVKHLHLHMVLPPFKHHKVFQYPRWHSHEKIVNDLKTHGKAILYSDAPNEAEGTEEYNRAIRNHNSVSDEKFTV